MSCVTTSSADLAVHKLLFFPCYSLSAATRPKRGFKFHEKGKFEAQAQKLRTKVNKIEYGYFTACFNVSRLHFGDTCVA